MVFLLALQASVQIKETVSDYGNLRTLLWLSIILLPLLGSVWILALLSVNDSLEELHYGFSLMSLISSVYIFVGYCLINHRVRHNIRVLWARLRGQKGVYIDDSLSGTRTSVASRSAPTFHNSSFDVLHRNMTICASSTTSRSTVTKSSTNAFRYDLMYGSLKETALNLVVIPVDIKDDMHSMQSTRSLTAMSRLIDH